MTGRLVKKIDVLLMLAMQEIHSAKWKPADLPSRGLCSER